MLSRWDPFQEMLNLRRTVDRLFDNATPDHEWSQPAMWGLSVDMVENKDDFVVKASVPGINPDDLDISYSDDTLTIKGEIKEEKETKERAGSHNERAFTKSQT